MSFGPLTRVAYFPDSFHEINGVAHTSRHFEDFARRRKLPFLCVRAGDRRNPVIVEGNLTTLELPRGLLSIPLDKDLKFDPAWVRHVPIIARTVKAFRPDVIHITGPSELGILGASLAGFCAFRWPLRGTPMCTSMRRRAPIGSSMGCPRPAQPLVRIALKRRRSLSRRASTGWPNVLFAPNLDLCRLLEARTGRRCHLMQRGIDAQLFCPNRRDRDPSDSTVILGFVGRLSVEKNIALLARVQKELEERGLRNFRFRIVGQGSEESWLRQHLPRAEFTGVLRGEALARAYAGMDVFVFPIAYRHVWQRGSRGAGFRRPGCRDA